MWFFLMFDYLFPRVKYIPVLVTFWQRGLSNSIFAMICGLGRHAVVFIVD